MDALGSAKVGGVYIFLYLYSLTLTVQEINLS